MPSAADRDALRNRELQALSPRYSPVLHVVLPATWGLGVIALCVAGVTLPLWDLVRGTKVTSVQPETQVGTGHLPG